MLGARDSEGIAERDVPLKSDLTTCKLNFELAQLRSDSCLRRIQLCNYF